MSKERTNRFRNFGTNSMFKFAGCRVHFSGGYLEYIFQKLLGETVTGSGY
jgi:hypothetical protein